jgi:ribonuclease VapC
VSVILSSEALVALICRDPGWERLVDVLDRAEEVGIGAPALGHAGAALVERFGVRGSAALSLFLQRSGAVVHPYGEAHCRVAASAAARYGEGRHQAALDADDCMTYATASLAGAPVLATGTRFPLTDLPIAGE